MRSPSSFWKLPGNHDIGSPDAARADIPSRIAAGKANGEIAEALGKTPDDELRRGYQSLKLELESTNESGIEEYLAQNAPFIDAVVRPPPKTL
ncbi:hypothetical protein GGE12_000594 [Rhizobium mongolense]|uniref:Uncharacterized protein n=1 Tax=Rhizobium mongolense TaxID=57676 RepID=A0A7W6RIE5_9HYPH|nr:hypothetical protein [Rhizobium mongolense]